MINTVYYFVDPDRGVEIFFGMQGATEWGEIDYEIGNLVKIPWRACLHFYCFWWQKIIAFKGSLGLYFYTFIPWLLNYFDLSSYGSHRRKDTQLRCCRDVLSAISSTRASSVWKPSIADTVIRYFNVVYSFNKKYFSINLRPSFCFFLKNSAVHTAGA